MRKKWKVMLTAVAVMTAAAGDASAQEGAWRGNLAMGQMKLPLVFNFSKTAAGETQCTLDSPSQGAKGIPTEVQLCNGDSVALTCNAIGAAYNGKVTGKEIRGVFRQRGYEFALNLEPEASPAERRPQTPKPPYPYAVTDTTFVAADGAVMAATLTLPRTADSRKMPAVVMVTGSGPQNRDEEMLDHKPFFVIADYLARHGIASLRYDDRGAGASEGIFLTSTTFTFRDDARSAVAFLRSMGCIGRVGVLGHSEGGTIALMLGAEGETDFVISLAGVAESGKEVLMRQNAHALETLRLPDADKESSLKLIGRLFDTFIEQQRKGVLEPVDIDALAAAEGLNVPPQVMQSLRMTQQIRTPWYDTFLTLNPREFLNRVKCPVLAINGERDTQVHPDNLAIVKEFVPHADTRLMPELNHMMQHAVTGEVAEYDEIRETISPEVLDLLAAFVEEAGNGTK